LRVSEPQRLLSLLEAFADRALQIEGLGDGAETLGRKVDTLQRVVQLLRLRTGRVENRLPMRELLASSIEVDQGGAGRVLRVIRARQRHAPTVELAEERGQAELQVPLILYLLRAPGAANQRSNRGMR
jgi:hypothetical protein